jgi:NTE family protein
VEVALALGGGAALGWAHIGVLRALAARGVKVGAVAGTSIGALAAVCAAADRLDVLETLARSANLRTILRYLDPHFRRGAMLGGRTISQQLQLHLGHLRMEELSIPCAAVACDLVAGTSVSITEGPVVEAVRASIAIPGIFQPVVRGDQLLVDGGLIAPVPVGAVRALSRLPVVAVNLQSDYARRAAAVGLRSGSGHRLTAMRVTRASIGLLLSQIARQSLTIEPPDMELALQVGHIDVRSFNRAHELIEIGYRAVTDAWPAIRELGREAA